MGFYGGSDGKESACNSEDLGSILRSGRSPGEGNGYPLQYSCLQNPMDRGAWRATVNGVAKSRTQLSDFHHGASQVMLVIKSPPANAGDVRSAGLILGSGRSPGGGNGNPLQYFCLEDPMDRESLEGYSL